MGMQKAYGKRELEKLLAECPIQKGARVVIKEQQCNPAFLFGIQGDVCYVHPSYVRRGALLARVDYGGGFIFSVPVQWLQKVE